MMDDPLYEKAKHLALSSERFGPHTLQRDLLIGYNRAHRLVDALMENGVVTEVYDSIGVRWELTHNGLRNRRDDAPLED